MSGQITTAYVNQFKDLIKPLAQQTRSRLRDTVMIETQNGEFGYYDQIGATSMVEKTARHGDTPLVETPHARRRVGLRDFEWADLIDSQDKIRLLGDPTSAYVINAQKAAGRQIDDLIIEAALATAYIGKGGTDTVAFDTSNQQIVHGSVGMTIDKLLTAKQKLDAAEVDDDDPRFMVCGSKQIKDLLNTTQMTNADYNTVKALAAGEIDTFLKFKFIRSERLALSSTTRKCLAYTRSALLLAIGQDVVARVGERPDKSYAEQVYAKLTMGATRMEENKIVEVQCTES